MRQIDGSCCCYIAEYQVVTLIIYTIYTALELYRSIPFEFVLRTESETECSVFPYGNDPEDSNIRIAPTYPSLAELEQAIQIFCLAAKLAALEKLLPA